MGVEKALESVSKLVTVALLLNNEDKCKQFHEKSGQTFNLKSLEEVATSINISNYGSNNWDMHIALKNSLKSYVNKEQVSFSKNLKSYDALNEFVTNVVSSESFGEFVPAEPKVVIAQAPVEVPAPKTEAPVEAPQTQLRKGTEEIQADFFMDEDEEDNEEDAAPKEEPKVEVKQEKVVLQEKQNTNG